MFYLSLLCYISKVQKVDVLQFDLYVMLQF